MIFSFKSNSATSDILSLPKAEHSAETSKKKKNQAQNFVSISFMMQQWLLQKGASRLGHGMRIFCNYF